MGLINKAYVCLGALFVAYCNASFATENERVKVVSSDEYYDGDLLAIKENTEKQNSLLKTGFILSTNNEARRLMDIVNKGKFDDRYFHAGYKAKSGYSETDTYMRPRVEDIKHPFKYSGVASIIPANVKGAAPGGTYIDGKWSAVAEYFSSNELGACKILISDLRPNGEVIINRDRVSYVVNGKPTTTTIEGSPDTGFTYLITWADNDIDHLFTCATERLNTDQIKKMESTAAKLDKAISL